MTRIAFINFVLGFIFIAIAAAAGPLLSYYLTDIMTNSPALLNGWNLHALRSAHAHVALFGLIHIAVGLTIPYSRLPKAWFNLITGGLFAGTLAVGPGLVVKSGSQPTLEFSWQEVAGGTLLSLFVVAIIVHIIGLSIRLFEK